MCEIEPGAVALATIRGKVRLLRYLPDAGEHPWVMDNTYDPDDYIHSNWLGTEPELVGFHIYGMPKLDLSSPAHVEAFLVGRPVPEVHQILRER